MPEANPPISPAAALRTERLLAATPQAIFAAFAQPEKLARWWGPEGFSNTFQNFDFQPGGRWVFVMHGPDGHNYLNECIFREIQPSSKIVLEHVDQPRFQLTITLAPEGEQTKLSWVQAFETAEMAEKLRPLCEGANEQNLDRLEAVLAET